MHEHLLPHISPRGSTRRIAAIVALAPVLLQLLASPVAAADLTMQAKVLLGSHVRIGSWAAVTVTIRNDGPPLRGELRLAGNRPGISSYATEVDLPTTSEKAFMLYGQPAAFSSELQVVLVSGGQTIASTGVRITAHDGSRRIIAIVAEHPERLVGDVTAATDGPANSDIIAIRAGDLPPRVEPWFAIDQLVWQDVDSASLSNDQLEALDAWLTAGGRLVVVGGTTGTTTLARFPPALLPYRPSRTVDATAEDIRGLLGSLSAPPGPYPALAGSPERGSVLASSGGLAIAAEAPYGRGATTLIGVDPAQSGLAGSKVGEALWRRALSGSGTDPRAFGNPDDTSILAALNRLPNVELPRVDQLFGLLAGYIVLVGPLNYLVLRRLDRREWAWLTIPALVLVFAVGTYGLGRVLKGDDVIVNQLSIVRTAGGTEQGLAQAYVGVFSPTRQKFDVTLGRAPLVSTVSFDPQTGTTQQQPLDVISGEKARIRGYQVGYGVLRGFRAEATVPGPLVESTLRFAGGRLQGEVRNRSNAPLEAGALVFGSAVQTLGTLEPGESRTIDMAVGGAGNFGLPLSDRLFGGDIPDFGTSEAQAAARIRAARRALVDQITVTSKFARGLLTSGAGGDAPILLGWHAEGLLPVELAGQRAQNLGQTLYAISLPVTVSGKVVLDDELLRYTVIGGEAVEKIDEVGGFSLSRGTLTVEYRPPAFQGRFQVDALTLGVTSGEVVAGAGGGVVRPLPVQPPQQNPSGNSGVAPDKVPSVQLFDRLSSRWVEFPRFEPERTYEIDSPARYVDGTGAFVVRFVNRGDKTFFRLVARLEGAVK